MWFKLKEIKYMWYVYDFLCCTNIIFYAFHCSLLFSLYFSDEKSLSYHYVKRNKGKIDLGFNFSNKTYLNRVFVSRGFIKKKLSCMVITENFC